MGKILRGDKMLATFYYNKSDKRYMNKSIEAKYSNINIEVVQPSSVVRPTLLVSSGLIGQGVNYVYVNELERYYYIKDWIMENGYIQLECEVDVLMSFKSAIKDQYVIVSRQEHDFNLYQIDEKMNCYNTPVYRTMKFPSGFTSSGDIVLVVAGASTGGA